MTYFSGRGQSARGVHGEATDVVRMVEVEPLPMVSRVVAHTCSACGVDYLVKSWHLLWLTIAISWCIQLSLLKKCLHFLGEWA